MGADDAVYELNGKDLLGERVSVEHARGTRRASSRDRGRYGPPTRTDYRVLVENLSTRVSWQDLKDLMRKAGDVTYADAHKDRRNEGVVEFATRRDMERALDKLNEERREEEGGSRDRAPGQGGGTPSRDQGPVAEAGRRLQSQSRDPGAAARGQSRDLSRSPSRGPDPSRRQRGRPAGERVRREMLRSPRVTPNLGPGLQSRKMEIQGDQGPSLRDQTMATHLLKRMGMEMRMETIDHKLKEIEGHFFNFHTQMSMR